MASVAMPFWFDSSTSKETECSVAEVGVILNGLCKI